MQLALSPTGDVAILELEELEHMEPQAAPWNPVLEGQLWSWTITMPITHELVSGPAVWVAADTWSPSQVPTQVPPAHLWRRPPFINLGADEEDGGNSVQ